MLTANTTPMKNITPLAVLTLSCAISTGSIAQAIPAHQSGSPWFIDAQDQLAQRLATETNDGPARNVILFIGDGMGLSTLTAARILDGQSNGQPGEEGLLSFEAFPFTALVKTYNVDAQIPDSAGTMSAMMTGIKTDAGVLGLDEGATRGNCRSGSGHEVTSLLELAELKGLSTGIVTTSRLTHATPAATYANTVNRDWEDDSDVPPDATAAGCTDIARQLVDFESRVEARHADSDIDGIDVAMGGGRRHFFPRNTASVDAEFSPTAGGRRTDGMDLVAMWQTRYPDGQYLFDREGFDRYDTEDNDPVLALFNNSHLRYALDNPDEGLFEPTLAQMTETAIRRLDNDDDGYLLIVEAGRIDHAHHAGNAHSALSETLALDDAVSCALETSSAEDTLVLVTADHGHMLSIAGHPRRGNPILGKVISVGTSTPRLAADGLPYTTLSYANGRGFRDLGPSTDADISYATPPSPGRFDLGTVDTTSTGFHQEALVPLEAASHAGEDVTLHALGPGAEKVHGVIEQNVIFHIINEALRLMER